MKSLFICLLFSTYVFLAVRCSGHSRQEEYARLLSQAKNLEQRHCRLAASIDSLWDVTSSNLDKSLPLDFPAIDRNIFLNARNADHMRMFMSFKLLDSGAQSIVNEAGKYDEILAVQMRDLLEQQQEFERQKIQFLRKTEQKDQEASRTYSHNLQQATLGLCK